MSPAETACGFICATAICITALLVDGPTAQTLAIGVAATMAGGAGYVVGKLRRTGQSA